MTMHDTHHTEHHEPGALGPTVWFAAALVVMVLVSYWLNAS